MSLRQTFERAGCRGLLHATSLDGTHEVGLDADAAVVPASVIKVLVALEAETRLTDGRLDPAKRVLVSSDARTTGPVGFSATTSAPTHSSNLRELIDSLARDTGFADWAAFEHWAATETDRAALDAAQARLRGSSAEACARVRWLMARQVTRNRPGLGFGPGVGVATKSGAHGRRAQRDRRGDASRRRGVRRGSRGRRAQLQGP